jgi:hypothetical protein
VVKVKEKDVGDLRNYYPIDSGVGRRLRMSYTVRGNQQVVRTLSLQAMTCQWNLRPESMVLWEGTKS